MIHDKNHLGILIRPGWEHAGFIWTKFIEKDEPMPVSVSFGGPPMVTYTGPTPFRTYVDEFDMAGALSGFPIETVKSEDSDIPVPAAAEIVIEGTIDPRKRVMEGPFGEYPGYYGSMPTPKPVIDVKTITYRNNPILIGSLEGYSINESSTLNAVGAAIAWDDLEAAGVPGIKNVSITRESGGSGHCIVSVKPIVEGIGPIIASCLWGSHVSVWRYKNVTVVDEDIDPWNLSQVDWAVWSRTKASESVHILKNTRGSPLDPRYPPEEKGFWDRLLIDSTRPFHWEPKMVWATEGVDKGIPLKFPPVSRPDPRTMELVNKRWDEYGVKPMEDIAVNGIWPNWWTPEFIDDLKKLKITR
jgi:4-hydroxy-3-polyprenylbenzoate decarboxylase